MKIKELLSDESKWTKGAIARDKDGVQTWSGSPNAYQWCLVGAIHKCYSNSSHIEQILANYFKGSSIAVFNDNATFAEIRKVIEELDI